MLFCTLSPSPSKSFRVAFRVLTSVKDAIFAFFRLIVSRTILKNLKEEATQEVHVQQHCSQVWAIINRTYFKKPVNSWHDIFLGGYKNVSRVRQLIFLLIPKEMGKGQKFGITSLTTIDVVTHPKVISSSRHKISTPYWPSEERGCFCTFKIIFWNQQAHAKLLYKVTQFEWRTNQWSFLFLVLLSSLKKETKTPQVVFILYESKGYLKHSNIFAASKHVSIQRWGMQHCLYRLFSWVYHRQERCASTEFCTVAKPQIHSFTWDKNPPCRCFCKQVFRTLLFREP